MKRIFFLTILILSAITSNAQSKSKLGVNGGLTYTSLRGNELVKLDPKFSYVTGVSFEYEFGKNISLGFNLNYENKGAKENGFYQLTNQNGTSEVIQSDTVIDYNYLVLPIYINYYFGTKNDFYVNGGFFTGYLLNASLSSKKFDNKTDISDSYKKMDAGLQFGLGKKFSLNDKNELKIEIRENLGLININDFNAYNGGSTKTNSLNLILNWNFTL